MEPEVEKFEITEEDYENEFNPNRRTFRQSKNQATYGVWAGSDSDDEGRPSFGGGRRGKKDFTLPVSFISGGVKVGSKITKEEDLGDEDEEEDESKSTPAATPESLQTIVPGSKRYRRGTAGLSGANKGFGNNKRQGMAGMNDLGNWEKHTKGIGAKLLGMMGHVAGKGLGKNQQGITTPVEAVQRKGKGAVGFHGTERSERSLQDFPVQADSEEEEESEFQRQLQQWKKPGKGTKKKTKYNYKTVDELIASGGKKKSRVEVQSELAKVKVIDMTGREQRVLSGYHALAHKHDRPEEEDLSYAQLEEKKQFDMPELLHNLDMLVDMAEDDILQSSKKLSYEQDLQVNLRHEKEKITQVCERERDQLDKLQEVLTLVDSCEKRSRPDCPDPLTLDECAEILHKLQSDYFELYKIYGLADMATGLVQPLMEREFADWEPMKKPRHGIVTVRNWKEVLSDEMTTPYQQGVMDPYQKILWEVWMPPIRTCISKTWQVRDCEPLIEVLEAWFPLLPEWMKTNLLDQMIMPKLQTEVDGWNPLTDTVPIHAWLHPWLPVLGDRLGPLYAPIRHKLAHALQNWHPSDPSAKMMLEPWNNVFRPGHMDAFVVKNVVPKLALAMQEFIINPHQQILDPWNWVILWIDLVPIDSLVSLLDATFFPKWIQVLCTWLSSNPNYDEVSKWYTGWKSMFPQKLSKHPAIKDKFNKALDIMNRAVSGQPWQPGSFTSERRNLDIHPGPPPPPPSVPMEAARGISSAQTTHPTNFRELIERRAEENNLIYLPIPNKFHEAKQVYKFGKVNLYIDRGVSFMFEPGKGWIPVSISHLVEKAKG